MWRRDFIKFPASRFPGWRGSQQEGGGGGGQCLAPTVLTEMWLGVGGRGPFWAWWLMDGKSGGAQNSYCEDCPPTHGGGRSKGTGVPTFPAENVPSWVAENLQTVWHTRHAPPPPQGTPLTNAEAKTLQIRKDGAGVQAPSRGWQSPEHAPLRREAAPGPAH